MTEYSYTQLTGTQLANNNIGAISEDDVRSIVDFARVHAMTVAGDYLDTSSGTAIDTTPEAGEPTAFDIHQFMDGATDDVTHSYNTGGLLSWSGKGFQYSSSGAVPRLFNLGWNSSLSFGGSPAEQSMGLVFYHVPDGETFGANGWTGNRIQVSYYTTVVPGLRDASQTSELFTSGSALVQLAPGETVVPVLESYNADFPDPRLSFSIDCHSVGVVESTVPALLWSVRSGDVSQATADGVEHEFDVDDSERGTVLPAAD